VSLQWDGDTWLTADERWASEALFTEPQMRFAAVPDLGVDDDYSAPWWEWIVWTVLAVTAAVVGVGIGLVLL
jgi:hypothetical protein